MLLWSITACKSESLLSRKNNGLLGSITASSADRDDPAVDVVDSGIKEWCTVEPFMDNNPAPYIQFNFTETVFLTHMRARGALLAFVTAFGLEILNDLGEFVRYGVTGESTVSS